MILKWAMFLALIIGSIRQYMLRAKLSEIERELARTKRKLLIATGELPDEVPEPFEYASGEGQAFCLGCRLNANKSDLLVNPETNEFYHRDCLPLPKD